MDKTFGLNLQITKKCNFNCSYCYEIGQHQDLSSSLDSAKDIIKLAKDINSTTGKKMALTFIGGEPTLNAEFAIVVLEEIYKLDLLASVTLITNGWSAGVIKDFFGCVPQEYIKIQISYDGKEINDRFRLQGKNKTTDLVLENFKSLLSSGYKVNLKSTMPIDGLHTVPEILREFEKFREEFGTRISYQCTEDFTTTFNKDRDFKIFKPYLNKAFEEILRFEIGQLKRGKPPISRWFMDYNYSGPKDCNAGISFFTINENGNIQYCHHVDYTADAQKTLEYINVSDPKAWEKMQNISKKNSVLLEEQAEECSDCDALFCVKCPILNFAITKDKEAMHGKHAVPFMCLYYKEISKYLYIYDTVKGQIKGQIKDQIKGQIKDKIKDQIKDKERL